MKMPEYADKISFYIGDVRDLQSVKNAIHGVNFIFHAAALKQVPSCEFFPIEAVKTNVLGTENVLTAAIEEGGELPADIKSIETVEFEYLQNWVLLDLSEGHSSGIPTIQDELERNGSPRAEFFTDDDRRAMRIRIPIHPVFLEEADKKPIKADREKLILEYVSEHGSIGNSEARELLGLAESTVKRLLTDMAKREILKDDGERKSRRYYLR